MFIWVKISVVNMKMDQTYLVFIGPLCCVHSYEGVKQRRLLSQSCYQLVVSTRVRALLI